MQQKLITALFSGNEGVITLRQIGLKTVSNASSCAKNYSGKVLCPRNFNINLMPICTSKIQNGRVIWVKYRKNSKFFKVVSPFKYAWLKIFLRKVHSNWKYWKHNTIWLTRQDKPVDFKNIKYSFFSSSTMNNKKFELKKLKYKQMFSCTNCLSFTIYYATISSKNLINYLINVYATRQRSVIQQDLFVGCIHDQEKF